MKLRLGVVLAVAVTPYLWSCSGDDNQQPKEPVAAEQDTNKVPDNPGASGETAATKPAGAGQADQAPAAAPEKSTPDAAAAANATPSAQTAAAGEMTVKAGALNVRKGPGTKNPVVRTLKRGEKVTPMSCDKGWCKLAENEYVSKKYLSTGK